MSVVVAILLVVIILGVIILGVSAATDGSLPIIGDDAEDTNETAIPTANSSPTPVGTPTTSPTPTQTTTKTPTRITTSPASDLERFKANFEGRLGYTLENDSITGVSPLALQYQETRNGIHELWLVYWECDNADDTSAQRITVGNYFANTAGNFEGRQPDRLVAYGVKNLESYPDSITRIPTSSAAAAYNRSMDPNKYTENWIDRLRKPTESESETTFSMTLNASGRSKAERAFHEHYPIEESDRGCPGAAESGSGG